MHMPLHRQVVISGLTSGVVFIVVVSKWCKVAVWSTKYAFLKSSVNVICDKWGRGVGSLYNEFVAISIINNAPSWLVVAARQAFVLVAFIKSPAGVYVFK